MFGRDHPNTLMTIMNLGVNLKDSGAVKESLPHLEEAYAASEEFPGIGTSAGIQLLDAYSKLGQQDKTIEFGK